MGFQAAAQSPAPTCPRHTKSATHNEERRYLIISPSKLLKALKVFSQVQGEGLLSASILPVIPTFAKKLQITVLYTYFNFCTGKEKEGENEDRLVYSDSIFAFKLIFALGNRGG